MPQNKELPLWLPNFHGPDSGGSLFVEAPDGGVVGYTRHGEMVCDILEDGSLLAEFPEYGLIYQYKDSGDLAIMSVNLRPFLCSMDMSTVEIMPNGGRSVIEFVRWMEKNNYDFYVTLMLDEKVLEITACDLTSEDDDDVEVIKRVEYEDLNRSLTGVVGVQDIEVAFEVTDQGDDLMMAFGETDGKSTRLIGIESSYSVDYEEEMFGDNPKRYQKLANKIILS